MELKESKWGKSVFSYIKWYDWCIIAAVYILLVLLSCHGDVYHTVKSSFALLEGHWSDFYTYNVGVVGGNDYNLLVYIIFALWNLPLFLFGGITPWPVQPSFTMIYEKALLMVFIALSAWMIYKICVKMGTDKRKAFYASALFFTAPCMLLTTVAFGMYDVIYGFFFLWGMYMFLRDKTKYDKWFSAVIFGLSFTVKPFALFIWIPIVLYRNKKVLKCICLFALSFLPLLLFRLPYMFGAAPSTTSGRFLDYLFGTSYSNGIWTIPIFAVAYVLICLWAYFKDYEDGNSIKVWYVALLAMCPFYVFVSWHPQWIMLFVVIFSVLAAVNKNKKKVLLFDGVLALGLIAFMWNAFGEAFGQLGVRVGPISKFFTYNIETPFLGNTIFPGDLLTVYIAISIAVIVFVTYCLNPWKFKGDYELGTELTKADSMYARLRLLIPIIVFAIPMILWIVQASI
ncbi:MAG: hypothetical protein RR612_10010 [Oscillospiraceae bacterium]